MANQILINYRREDSSGFTGRLYDRIAARFSPEEVFMDVSAIGLGTNFVQEIENALASCKVFIAIIGPRWISIADEAGNRRIDDPNDFVRLEIAQALKQEDILVVPLLLQGAKMPEAAELPEDISELAHRQYLEIGHTNFDIVVDKLLGDIEPYLELTRKSRRWLWAIIGLLVLAGLTWGLFQFGILPPDGSKTTAAPTKTQRAATATATDQPSVGAEIPRRTEVSNTGFTACMVTDLGGIDDKTFNTNAWKGVQDAIDEFGIEGVYLESKQESDYEKHINAFLDEDCDIIFSVGFALGEATETAAKANPTQDFAIIDLDWYEISNLYGSSFAVNEVTFLAGYLSAGMTESGIIATYGGIQFEAVENFMDGYALGANYYNEVHNTDIQVLGWDPDTRSGLFAGNFDSITYGRETGESLIEQGADIIFPVAGPIGSGTLEVVEDRKAGSVIGADTDWVVYYPDYAEIILASVLKRVDVFVYKTIQDKLEDKFTGGNYYGTLSNGGIELAYGRVAVPSALKSEIEDLIPKIKSGEIKTLP